MFPMALLAASNALAQGTVEDYKRAYSLYDKFNATYVYNSPENIEWNGKAIFSYSTYTPDGIDYHIGTVSDGLRVDTSTVNMKAWLCFCRGSRAVRSSVAA